MPPMNGLCIPALFLPSLVAACKNIALKYQRMPQYYIRVLIYLVLLTLGPVDLDTELGQLQICANHTIVSPNVTYV